MRILAHSRNLTGRQRNLWGHAGGFPDAACGSGCAVNPCAVTANTKGLVDRRAIASMRKGAYLVNTSRGQIVDEAALYQALKRRSPAGAGLDVLSVEPPRSTIRCSHLILWW